MVLLILSLLSFNVFAHSNQLAYLNEMADTELARFDHQLDMAFVNKSDFPLSTNLSYLKLQVLRDRIEHSHTTTKSIKTKKQLDLEITSEAQNFLIANTLNTNVIFPSASGSGQITGRRYSQNVWSITYDDGPKNKNSLKILELLRLYNYRATFFMLTSMAVKNDTYALEIAKDMDVALHSYTHLNLNKYGESTWDYEVGKAKQDLEDVMGFSVDLFRLPYGSGTRNKNLRTYIAKEYMVHVFWNVDSLDWKDKDPASIMTRVEKQMAMAKNGGGVILFHDHHPQTVKATKLLLDKISREKIVIRTVNEEIEVINQR
jgi:peptidoglycan/xylan/chitin deacetylase (PgdA/CDA1 family)